MVEIQVAKEEKSVQEKASRSRVVGLDVLRCLSMLMVVGIHAATYTGICESNDRSALNHFFIVCFKAVVIVGVNCFWLISGYFLSQSKTFRLKRCLALWGWVIFYSWLSLALSATFTMPPSGRDLLVGLFPIWGGCYWFMSVYLALLFLAPFVNRALHAFSRSQHVKFLSVALVLTSILPVLNCHRFDPGSFNLVWALILYWIGGFIRLHVTPSVRMTQRAAWGTLAGYALLFICLAANLVCKKLWGIRPFPYEQYNFPVTCFVSISLFLFFLGLPMRADGFWGRGASVCVPNVLGVYLIHESPFVRGPLWAWVGGSDFRSAGFPLRVLLSVPLIFVTCLVLDRVLHFGVRVLGQFLSRSFPVHLGSDVCTPGGNSTERAE